MLLRNVAPRRSGPSLRSTSRAEAWIISETEISVELGGSRVIAAPNLSPCPTCRCAQLVDVPNCLCAQFVAVPNLSLLNLSLPNLSLLNLSLLNLSLRPTCRCAQPVAAPNLSRSDILQKPWVLTQGNRRTKKPCRGATICVQPTSTAT